MKKYFNEGLLPQELIEDMFDSMMIHRTGKIMEHFIVDAKKSILKFKNLLYDNTYLLEGYINEVAKEKEWSEDFCLGKVIEEATLRALRECLHDNIWTFADNYTYKHLSNMCVSKKKLAEYDITKVIDWITEEEITYEEINEKIKEYAKNVC